MKQPETLTITLPTQALELLANALQAQTASVIAEIQRQANEQMQPDDEPEQ